MATVQPYVIAVVGTGPRGVLLLERLIARLNQWAPRHRVEIHAIDAIELGCGSVWRTDQPDCLVMDNSADEVTLYSEAADVDAARAGYGPSFANWLAKNPISDGCGIHVGPVFYPARRLYGCYLKFAYASLSRDLPENLTLHGHQTTVLSIEPQDKGYQLALDQELPLFAHSVILCTGHATLDPDTEERQIRSFADAHGLTYLSPSPTIDSAMDNIGPRQTVGIVGLGLAFYDALMLLTEARGGRFERLPDHRLRYRRSGREPTLIVAGSRTGIPIPVRGVQQRPTGWRYVPRLFTERRVWALREKGPLDFRQDVQPWINAEINLVYFETLLRQTGLQDSWIDSFADEVQARISAGTPILQAIEDHRTYCGLGRYPLLDLQRLANPFHTLQFESPTAFRDRLLEHVRQDLEHALRGNVASPMKAALEILRDTRSIQRIAVDFCGLNAQSHQQFIHADSQPLSFLSAGTPLYRSQQLIALIDAGLLRIVGPRAEVETEAVTGKFNFRSLAVNGSAVRLDALIDARIPKTNIHRDGARLTRKLVSSGLWTSKKNTQGAGSFDTGGVDVDPELYLALGPSGRPWPRLYVLGLPTEHTRWFMQVGIVRPGLEKMGLGQDCERVVTQLCQDIEQEHVSAGRNSIQAARQLV